MAGTIDELSRTIASRDAMLFTGAGFSSEARDVDGNPLPDSKQMIAELWPICFHDECPDDSSLADLYDVALVHARDRLRDYVGRRLRVGDAKLPPYLAAWLGAPWKRIYTLNVDDLGWPCSASTRCRAGCGASRRSLPSVLGPGPTERSRSST
jgi:hypothetical protein